MLPLILIIVVLVIGLVFMAWQLKKWTTELDEVNVRFDQVVAEAEYLTEINVTLILEKDQLVAETQHLATEKDRAFRRMRKAEQLLADYRAAGYTQFDFDALRNEYEYLKRDRDRLADLAYRQGRKLQDHLRLVQG